MGYTHYWTYNPNAIKDTEILRKKFRQAVFKISAVYQAHIQPEGIVLCGGLGEGNPVIQETELWFNGDGSKGLDHETFNIHWSKSNGSDFCKTARKPYDIMVGLSLLILQKYLGKKVLTFSSDGGNEDWAEIYEVYEKVMGEPAPKFKS